VERKERKKEKENVEEGDIVMREYTVGRSLLDEAVRSQTAGTTNFVYQGSLN
jgi:hypothetical protein